MQIPDFSFDIWWTQIQCRADKEIGGLADACSRMINASIKSLLDEFDKARGYKIIIVHGFWIITNRGRVTHYDKHIMDAKRVRSEQIALYAEQIAAARREVERSLDTNFPLDHITHRPGRHSHTCHRGVSNIDNIRARVSEE
jgi:hypothetical protein